MNFSQNNNNKLFNNFFTTIRNKKYNRGEIIPITFNDKVMGKAKVLGVRKYKLSELPDFICHIDTGMNKKETLKLLSKIYEKPLTLFKDQYIFVIMLKYTDVNFKLTFNTLTQLKLDL